MLVTVVLNLAMVRASFPDWQSQLEWGGRLEGPPAMQGAKLEGAPWTQGFGGSQPPKAARQTGLYKDDNLQLTDTAFTPQSDKPSKTQPKVSSSLWSNSPAKPGPYNPANSWSSAPSKEWSENPFNPQTDIQSNPWSQRPTHPHSNTPSKPLSTKPPVVQAGHSIFPYDPRPEKRGPESRTFGEDEVKFAIITLTSQ